MVVLDFLERKLLILRNRDGLLVGMVGREFGLGSLALLRVRSSMCFVAGWVALVETIVVGVVAVAVGMGRMRAEWWQQLGAEDFAEVGDVVDVEENCIFVLGWYSLLHIHLVQQLHRLYSCTSHLGIEFEEVPAGIELAVEDSVEWRRPVEELRQKLLELGICRMRIVAERECRQFLVLVLSVYLGVVCEGRRRCRLRLQR